MALLHWYIIPIGIELEFNPVVLDNFSHFVEAVEMAMTIKPKSEAELNTLHHLLCTFLEGFQRIYIGDNPEKVARCRLCIFQLIHVPIHIKWNGSIRVFFFFFQVKFIVLEGGSLCYTSRLQSW